MQYHIARNGQQAGIFSEEDIRAKLLRNEFSSSDLCWTEGMAEWLPLSVRFAQPAAPVAASAGGINPYAPPQANIVPNNPAESLELASPGERLVAVIFDGLVGLVLAIPIGIGLALSNRSGSVSSLGMVMFSLSGLLLVGLAIYNLVLLATRGQTIGKKIRGIRIVTYPDGQNPGWVKTILLRAFVNGLIGAVPLLGPIYSLVDILFIFREDRRCIHDMIAGTQVVKGQPPGY